MKNLFNVRNILISAFILLFVAGIGYKYYEWSTLQSLSTLYNQSWTGELNAVQQENKNNLTFIRLYKKVFDKNAPKDSFATNYSELSGDLQLVINSHQNYLNLIQQNSTAYSNINTTFLFGKRGDFAKKIISDQKKYYAYEIDDAVINNAANWLEYDMMGAWNDMATVNQFSSDISQSPATSIPKYFSELSSLQKYTNNDFHFQNESDIQKYYPDGYDGLIKYKDYFATDYTTVQNFTNEDYQSAQYTFNAFKESSTNLNFNIFDLFKQESNHLNSNANSIIQLVSDQSNSIKDFDAQGLGKYPILTQIPPMEVDLVACQMYDFKSGLYNNITTNYIKSNNSSALLDELSSIPPSTQSLDSKFDKRSMLIVNNDKEIQFTCIDKATSTKYQFVTLK